MTLKHLIPRIAVSFFSLFLTLITQGADAVGTNPPPLNIPQQRVPVDRASSPKNPNLLELEKRLRPIILAAQPESKIELVGDSLRVYYYSERFTAHLWELDRANVKRTPEQFPDDYSEFSMSLGIGTDWMYYRTDSTPAERSMIFGSSYYNHYNLRQLPLEVEPYLYADIPRDHWVYSKWQELFAAKLVGAPDHIGPLTRYELAVIVARLRNEIYEGKKSISDNSKAKSAMAALEAEFSPELNRLLGPVQNDNPLLINDKNRPLIDGQAWRPRYEYLSLRFNYGKGVDKALVEKIKQTIATYASENLKDSENDKVASARK